MDIESTSTQERSGVFGRLKTLPVKAKDKIVNIGKSTKKLGKDDPRRVIHSLKVGLALTLVSLIYYWRPLYDGFGVSGMWAVLTVVVVFEFSVGATIGKGLNRGIATLLAGVLGVGALHLSSLFGKQGEPIVLGILVFLLAGAATFSRFFPTIKARYDYGVLIFILTFSMISVSGYRVENLLAMAHQRLSTILIGGATCVFISIFVCPVWAGQDLHNLIASNIDKLANFLQGFGDEYYQDDIQASKNDKSFLKCYKSVLNTKANEETLANFAKWEPGHGRFLFRHPWKQYLKVGGLARQCAYQIEALSSYLTSETKAPEVFVRTIQDSCKNMSSESGKALKSLATSMKAMKQPDSSAVEHLEKAKKAVTTLKGELEAAREENYDIVAIVSVATIATMLVEIVESVEKISHSVHELSNMARFEKVSTEDKISPEIGANSGHKSSSLLHRGSVKPVMDCENAAEENHSVIITLHELIRADHHLPENDVNPHVAKPREVVVV